MKLLTKYFGEIEYQEEDILTFPKGLFAFEEETEFLLLPFSGSSGTLLCLQSTATPQLAFVVMNPFSLDGTYAPVLQPEELEAVDPAGGSAAAEPETQPVDQTALDILGPDAVTGGANAGAGAG